MRVRTLAVACAVLVLAACANRPPHWSDDDTRYTVRSGDTVYSIAFRHGLDWRDLARWNDIGAPQYLIRVGDTLRLTAPTAARVAVRQPLTTRPAPAPTQSAQPPRVASANEVRFRWPAQGDTVKDDKGIRIMGRAGADILAAAAGRVVYTGSGLVGYGRLIIVKHNNQLLSAYAHNQEILVREGDDVQAGQRIATMGEGPGRRAMLHFEIRVDGQAVDPLQHLPRR